MKFKTRNIIITLICMLSGIIIGQYLDVNLNIKDIQSYAENSKFLVYDYDDNIGVFVENHIFKGEEKAASADVVYSENGKWNGNKYPRSVNIQPGFSAGDNGSVTQHNNSTAFVYVAEGEGLTISSDNQDVEFSQASKNGKTVFVTVVNDGMGDVTIFLEKDGDKKVIARQTTEKLLNFSNLNFN